MGPNSCLGDFVNCYCVERVSVGANATVSQFSYLCTAGHNYERLSMDGVTMELTAAPICIDSRAWVAADVYVGPGVRIGTGAVIGARASVFKDIPEWTIAVGTPARPIKPRNRVD
jgi:putative colanic acid biosynthesis acetyltransferase WcaF